MRVRWFLELLCFFICVISNEYKRLNGPKNLADSKNGSLDAENLTKMTRKELTINEIIQILTFYKTWQLKLVC